MNTTRQLLIDAAREIGNICESNCHYTAGLAHRIDEYGKPVSELTVAELLELSRQHTDQFNRIYA
ncbi:MAG TPA: hypothetical protein ENJ35_02420 [Gammaproteobacteria bacterium]|nr:hypothetical protein [Gammaproteobacteria bacterium]